MKSTWVCLALAVPLLAIGQAAAQEEERPRRDGEMRQRMIEEFDADGDGELNDEERQNARATMRERRGDRPGRGQARGGEGRGGQGRGGEGRGRGPSDRPAPPDPNELFDRFDENKDGQLSRDEFMQLTNWTREMRERFAGAGPRGRGPRGEGVGGPGRGGPRGDRPPRPQRPDAEPAPSAEAPTADDGSA